MAEERLRLLDRKEVEYDWPRLRSLLAKAIEHAEGELEVDDILTLVKDGRMVIFATSEVAVTCEFVKYPRKTVMLVGFGAGRAGDRQQIEEELISFAKAGGASAIQTYCKNHAMTRYYRRWFGLSPIYQLLERSI